MFKKKIKENRNLTHPDIPTLTLIEHPRSIRLIPVLRHYLSLQKEGVVIADQVFTIIAKLLKINHIPIRRDLSRYEPDKSKVKKIIMKIIAKLTNPDPSYKHQGKDIDNKVVTAMLNNQNILLAPSGVAKSKKWRDGVAFMLDAIVNNKKLKEFAISFVYVPNSFKEKHSFVLINSWDELLDKWENLHKLTNHIPEEFWTNNPNQNKINLQALYESLRDESK
jgi:hypothetical protein